MKKTKQKLMIVVIFLVVFIVVGFYSFNNKDPYKKYNHIQVSEVLKENQHEYWVYFVEMKDKEIKIKKQIIQPTTLLYIKNHKIVETYQGLKHLKEKHEEILEMSW